MTLFPTATEQARHINGTNDSGFALVEDASHWADNGIHTGEELERYLLACDVSDMSKEVYGFRQRMDWRDWSLELLQAKVDCLQRAARDQREYEERVERETTERTQRAFDATPLTFSLAEVWG